MPSQPPLSERLERYLSSMRSVLSEVKLTGEAHRVGLGERASMVVDLARRYYQDAEHYKGAGDLVTSLVCVVYGEGLLDALRALGLVEYRWPSERWDDA